MDQRTTCEHGYPYNDRQRCALCRRAVAEEHDPYGIEATKRIPAWKVLERDAQAHAVPMPDEVRHAWGAIRDRARDLGRGSR